MLNQYEVLFSYLNRNSTNEFCNIIYCCLELIFHCLFFSRFLSALPNPFLYIFTTFSIIKKFR